MLSEWLTRLCDIGGDCILLLLGAGHGGKLSPLNRGSVLVSVVMFIAAFEADTGPRLLIPPSSSGSFGVIAAARDGRASGRSDIL